VPGVSATAPDAAAGVSATAPDASISTGSSIPAERIPGVASQLVSVVSPLRSGVDGTQTLTVALHPADLGDVRVTVTTTDQNVVVRMSAASDAGRDALRQNLPQLQQQLSSDGQQATVVLADAGGQDSHRQSGPLEAPEPATFSDGSGGADPSAGDVAPGQSGRGDPAGSRLLDLRL
jgi:hypothetical protein